MQYTWTRRVVLTVLAAGMATTAYGPAAAQDAPQIRRLEVVVPYSAGGGTDRLSRSIVAELEDRIDAQISVRNVPGDAAMLGLSRIARAAPDAPMLAFHNPPNTVLAQLARGDDAPVDIRELTPIAAYAQTFSVLAVNSDTPYETFEELQAAYQNGEIRLFGGTDRGGSAELAASLIREQWEVPFEEYVAYDGSGDLNAALARGEVPAGIGSLDATLSAMSSGTVRPLVVLGAQDRQTGMENAPTAIELGLTSLAEVAAPTRIIVGPPDMEPSMRDYFVGVFRDTLTDPAVVEKFASNGVELLYVPPEDVDALIRGAFDSLEGLPALEAMMSGN